MRSRACPRGVAGPPAEGVGRDKARPQGKAFPSTLRLAGLGSRSVYNRGQARRQNEGFRDAKTKVR